ncbi:MAG: substrate-binding domain-containing protein [Hyphomicrobiaceae bacterium]|nr:substrate-binding domain-containing protein [Hyphomicrobiaceae bacterium]MCC0024434.1 substrate-binding domain-containing protein [Hyphomicrobiaceae bacterium]
MKHLAMALFSAVAVVGMSAGAYAQDGLVVGVSWNNFQEERWGKWDEPAMKEVLAANGATYISTDAQSSATKQLSDIENLISQGADAIIILAQDTEAIQPAVQKALDEGIPVIGYDRLIENPGAFYVTFDNKGVGVLMAQTIYSLVPKGNYVFIKGNAADPNADFLFSGMMEVIGGALDSGDIKNVGETYTDNWDPTNAQREMEQFLTVNNNNVDAVLSENDGMASGVVAALAAQGLAGQVPVSGQDADLAALNRVALGTQSVSVWKDARDLGHAAAQVAVDLAGGASMDSIDGSVMFDGGPKGVNMHSIFLTPIPITRDNLNLVIDAGWISKEQACQGVAAGTVAVCG